MEFVRLRIHSTERGPIYEKDYSVQSAFELFIKSAVSKMVSLGVLIESEHYWATISPQSDVPAGPRRMVFEVRGAEESRRPAGHWLKMTLPEPADPPVPFSGFILDLYTVPDATANTESVHFRWRFPVKELNYLGERAKASLIQRGILRKDEAVLVDCLAVSGDAPNFDAETILDVPDKIKSLQEKLSIVVPGEDWPVKPLPACNCGEAATDDGLVIFVRRAVWAALNAHMVQHGSRRTESGGILIGDVFRRSDNGRLFIDIEDFIAASQTQADAVSLRFTHETWQTLQKEKRERFPGKRVVGWYHSHPPMRFKKGDRDIETVAFFSTDDRQMHRQSFSEPWQVALVMDAESRNPESSTDRMFFRWERGEIVSASCHLHG